ncbi:MAG TPA: hypothetical protein VFQ77_05085 [Pseudonocardiaceae bacterium]|jgi:hypothetical protein|nr:hypothetical protein [Pseudonocardiaceae bacterium]
MSSSFAQSQAQLAGIAQQHAELRAAVDAGELWMDADVAERAATRCDQAVKELDDWLAGAEVLTRKRKFGTNEDGEAAAEAFAQAGREYLDTLKNAQRVIANMAETFRAAGRTAAQADEAGQQMIRGTGE